MSRVARRLLLAALVVSAGFPPTLVVVQSFADRWTGRALLPQEVGARGWTAVLGEPLLLRAVTNSALVAVLSVLAALPLGYGAAHGIASMTGRARVVTLAVVLSPLVIPQLAVGAGLTTWLLRLGLADTITGVAAAHLLYVLPYVVLALLPGFGARLTAEQEAASVLGARRLLLHRTVTLPALKANLALALALGFVVSWSQYGTSLAVGGGMPLLPLIVVPFVRADPQLGAALTVVLLLPAIALAVTAATMTRPTLEVR